MSITRISKKAFAIVAECPNEKKPYGITVDPISDKEFKFVWAFKISREGASREGFDKKKVHGSIQYDANYNGCPYCGAKGFFQCAECGKTTCWNGESETVCEWCGNEAETAAEDKFDSITGGGF